ncbi:PREDICTED: coronin-7 isoform X2 [Ceratosolen solmsi marchali]|uniref:Coronin n=1 Tax=Ceratosolen solmsi marchali TaxID=326594 RepID=A0AAJ6YRS2_9HYME|nr:PREDICTED: coronin-7 isoform X2 [Ceratosolen solmsi marchali]
MAWRFKASKYKNATPIVPKPEACIRDICVGSYQTYGNNIAASAAFMAFNVDHNGSSLAVLPLEDCGRKSKLMPLLHAHGDTVTDMDFSPFHDGLLATGSQDCLVKLWHIPEIGLEEPLCNPECIFSHRQRRVEVVRWHPCAEHLLTTVSYTKLTLWDVLSQKELFSNVEHKEVIQSLSWKHDGTLLATSCKDKQVRVIDPRAAKSIVQSASSHQSIKDSRIVWLGNSDRLLTTGFDSARLRQVYIRDLRNLNDPVKTLELDCSTGILMPLFDPDTNMLFLAGKGDTTIMYMEVTEKDPYLVEGIRHSGEQTKGVCVVPKRALNVMQAEVNRVLQLTSTMVIPIMYQVPRKTYRDFHADIYPDTTGYITQNTAAAWIQGHDLSVPKISLDPAKRNKGEEPMTPRLGPKPFQAKSASQEFSFDKVFSVPHAPSGESNGHVNNDGYDTKDLMNDVDKSPTYETDRGKEFEPIKSDSSSIEEDANSSDSGYKPKTPSTAERRRLFEVKVKDESPENEDSGNFERGNSNRNSIAERRRLYENRSASVTDGNLAEKATGSPTSIRRRDSFKTKSDIIKEDDVKKVIPILRQQSMDPRLEKPEPITTPTPKRTSTVFGRVSKFRHLKGTSGHKSTHIENIRNISRQVSGECDGFHANSDRVAVPLSGPGGKIAVLELKRTGRLPDGVMPALVHGATVMDFQWDPFDNQHLAVACDDGMIRLWEIPNSGLMEPTNEPNYTIEAHTDKIYLIKFHPLAADVLASASYDMTVKIWDLEPLISGLSIKSQITLHGHTDQIFSLAWSPCGQYVATACKAGKLRIYKPRSSDIPIREGKGPVGTRGARVVWALDGRYLVVMGFDKVSERQILVFKSDNLNAPLNTVGLDVSPAILMPYYDEDSSTLFLTGRGDSTIYAFEVTEEAPFCCPLSHHRCASLHQGLSFLPKNKCDVASVEFASALRLTNNTIEPLSFTVPRIKSELFQDDLFPPTKVTWIPAMSSREWFDGVNKQVLRINLKPPGMDNLTENQGQAVVTAPISAKQNMGNLSISQPYTKLSGYHPDVRAKQLDMQKNLSILVGDVITCPLEQDYVEGVEDHEWDD